MGHHATVRQLCEQALEKQSGGEEGACFSLLGNLSVALSCIGDYREAVAVQTRAANYCTRVLGPAHPDMVAQSTNLARSKKRCMDTGSAFALGHLVGLKSKPELNGKVGYVRGFGDGRYRVYLEGSDRATKPLGIKPINLVLHSGTAVIVEGLVSAPEWNGKRGIVQSCDEEHLRYKIVLKDHARPLGVKFTCCRLESWVRHEKKAEIAKNVAAALAERSVK